MGEMVHSPLHDLHLAQWAKMVQVGERWLPFEYEDAFEEHLAAKRTIALSDLAHMGRIDVIGEEAELFLDYLSTNLIANRSDGSLIYTLWSSVEGGTIDDPWIYRHTATYFSLIVHQERIEKDLLHLTAHQKSFSVRFARSQDDQIITLQGPYAERLLCEVFSFEGGLKAASFIPLLFQGDPLLLACTSYGSDSSFELILPKRIAKEVWLKLHQSGENYNLRLAGMKARNTLRLEAGSGRYGSELSEEIAPIETLFSWMVKWKKHDFLGKEALLRLSATKNHRSQAGAIIEGRGSLPPSEGSCVWRKGEKIGIVTSSGYSPYLEKILLFIMVRGIVAIGEKIDIEWGGKRRKAIVARLPFS